MLTAFIPTYSFAINDSLFESEEDTLPENSASLDAEDVSVIVEDLTDAQETISNINKDGDEFIIGGEKVDIIVSEAGDGDVTIEENDNNAFSMNLPKQFSSMKGESVDEETVVFNDGISNVSAAVQGVHEKQGDVVIEGFRSLMIIENSSAPHEYKFEFNMPEGCKLVKNGDYINIVNEKK